MLHKPLEPSSDSPKLTAELLRAARRLRLSGRQVVGLLPVRDDVSVTPILLKLGASLASLSGGQIAVVDANTRWPAFPEGLAAARGAAYEASQALENAGGGEYWVGESLVVLSPPRSAARSVDLAVLEQTLDAARLRFPIVLVDLTGLDALGEHLGAIALLDGVLFVARAGRTSASDLERGREAAPAPRSLGVLLVG